MDTDEILAMLGFAVFLGLVLYRPPLLGEPTYGGEKISDFITGPAYLLANRSPDFLTAGVGLVSTETPMAHDASNVANLMIGG